MPFLFQRVDLPGARTGGLPPFAGSPSRGARIFQKKKKKKGRAISVFSERLSKRLRPKSSKSLFLSFADLSLISGPGPASPEDGEDLEARSASECGDHRGKNDSKSRLAIPNSFLQYFGHRCIFRLPIFGRGFCRFHFYCERSFQIPPD